jgi:hypothetical protein
MSMFLNTATISRNGKPTRTIGNYTYNKYYLKP